ncbi:hypothetical protein VNI00_004278 [Paramarasmius palmivorus]|uniref:DUF6534 domain-containing protein n=1 Tax=Paramarasmius palmivorus TaxID=297713 RepID=A0AAW0DL45_9AGAR
MSSAPPDLSNVTGPLLLGYLFNYGLYGVLAVQTYIYYTAFPNDRKVFQYLVYGIFLVETMQTIMITYDAFQQFAYGFANVEALDKIHLIWFDCCIVDGLVAFCVQVYFAYRIHLLSRSKALAGVVLFMALTQFAGATAAGILAKIANSFALLRERCFIAGCIWLGGSAAVDITIAVSMTYILSRYDTGFQETQDLVKRLIRLTMETGSLTAAVAIIDLALFLAFPAEDYHITPALALAKFYSNSLLVVFNSRVRIHGGRGSDSTADSKGAVAWSNRGQTSITGPAIRLDVQESVWTDPIPLERFGPALSQKSPRDSDQGV